MGNSYYSDDFYYKRQVYNQSRGISAFAYDADTKTRPQSQWVVHPNMDPHGIIRESRDSDAHPESLAIGVIFDVTGSMGIIPQQLQKKLPQLMGLLLRKGYVAHPQILFGAVGDTTCDRIPLQIGQFESGIEMDEDLSRIVLEGGGGGQRHESYGLAYHFFGTRTSIDCFEKRRKRGYLFVIGDEMPWATTATDHVNNLLGDTLQESLSIQQALAEASRLYHVFFVLATGGHHGSEPEVQTTWTTLLGERVLYLREPDAVCEAIALAIGTTEEAVDLDQGLQDIRDTGASAQTVSAVGDALAVYTRNRSSVKKVDTSGLPGVPAGQGPRVRRL